VRAVVAAVAAAAANNLPLNQSLLGPLDSRGLFFEVSLINSASASRLSYSFPGRSFPGRLAHAE
jgi:hypothetical protein